MNNDKTFEKKNLLQYTSEVLEKLELDPNNCVSTSYVYRFGNDKKKIRGLNIQMYGHKLIIVPDIRHLDKSFDYLTHSEEMSDTDQKKKIFEDLLSHGFTQIDVAKLMKCSQGTVSRILGEK